MSFFASLFAPDVTRLESELAQMKTERDWFKARATEAGMDRLKAEAALKAEINRNRKREDLLQGQILELGGAHRLPPRIEEPKVEEVPEGLSPAAASTLRDRAEQYRDQKYPEERTDEKTEEIYQMMLADPETWLSD